MVLTNVYGAALTIRATMDPLKESKGHLLLTGSVAGRRALQGSLYSATKWAVTGMGEAARQDFNDTGVRVTLIEPGMTDTPFFDTPAADRGADARRHRPRGHVRRAAAAARRRQRDPDPADRAAELRLLLGGRLDRDDAAAAALVELHDPAGLLAKIVSSLPIPTPAPGWNLVPRWRTMISPPVTVWPANTFTPRRLELESRPLRLEPSPFL